MMNDVSVDWRIYYEELWQFVLTLCAQIFVTLSISFLLFKTIYLFYCRNGENYGEPEDGTRSSFKILTIVYLFLFALYVMTSLAFRSYVIFFNGHDKIYCWVIDFMVIWFLLSRLTLQFIYLYRVYTSFENSAHAYSTSLLLAIGIFGFIGMIFVSIWCLYTVYSYAYTPRNTYICASDFNWAISGGPVVLWDVVSNIIVVSLFIKKLLVLIRITENNADRNYTISRRTNTARSDNINTITKTNTNNNTNHTKTNTKSNNNNNNTSSGSYNHQNYNSGSSGTSGGGDYNLSNTRSNTLRSNAANTYLLVIQKATFHRDIALIRLISKFTVLLSVHIASSILLLALLSRDTPSAALCIGGWINSIGALYFFQIYWKEYKKYCCLCHGLAFRCCACFIFYKDTQKRLLQRTKTVLLMGTKKPRASISIQRPGSNMAGGGMSSKNSKRDGSKGGSKGSHGSGGSGKAGSGLSNHSNHSNHSNQSGPRNSFIASSLGSIGSLVSKNKSKNSKHSNESDVTSIIISVEEFDTPKVMPILDPEVISNPDEDILGALQLDGSPKGLNTINEDTDNDNDNDENNCNTNHNEKKNDDGKDCKDNYNENKNNNINEIDSNLTMNNIDRHNRSMNETIDDAIQTVQPMLNKVHGSVLLELAFSLSPASVDFFDQHRQMPDLNRSITKGTNSGNTTISYRDNSNFIFGNNKNRSKNNNNNNNNNNDSDNDHDIVTSVQFGHQKSYQLELQRSIVELSTIKHLKSVSSHLESHDRQTMQHIFDATNK